MSRGLGKVQRTILHILKDRNAHGWYDVGSLAYQVFDPVYGAECFSVSGYNPEKPADSQMQSFWRAIRLLEERGLLESRKVPRGLMDRSSFGPKRGGISFIKEVRLNV